ncbi:hypothetical protein VW29_18055 [Devosia limi DSM 17137]|uniref:Uncharacterized protein n=1 Tax=Devosia limi DSM 17137 TaxID=1121477 RepID=A0A0F5L4J2_9HYPH|nr:hypothetical protein [Devosia limi]KKB77278.1 hypothetical protein VW29_18055 [Devosia limi DSM 17137]SHE64419.1 hypothetical protein SAMN02745223_00768 [Devosia limi DSM 17137]
MLAISMQPLQIGGQNLAWPHNNGFAIDFENQRALRNSLNVPLTGSFALTRASAKYARRGNGTFEQFGTDIAALTDLGLSLEPAATNHCTWSADLEQSVWHKTAVTLTTGIVDPVGGASAIRVTEGAAHASLSRIAIAVTAGSTYTLTRIVRRGNCDWIRLIVGDSAFANAILAWFNLVDFTTGSMINAGAGYGAISRSIKPIGLGYALLSVTFAAPAGSVNVGITTALADGTITRASIGAGAGIGTCYEHWNTQLETGDASSPIISAATPADRAADSLTLPLAPSIGTLALSFDDGTSQTVSLATALPAAFDRTLIRNLAATA